MTHDCKHIHREIVERESTDYRDGWSKTITSAWEIGLSIVLVVVVAVWVAV